MTAGNENNIFSYLVVWHQLAEDVLCRMPTNSRA
jgi:hypothetical protein